MHNNNLLVRPDPVPDTTAGGIALPEAHKDKPISGLVVEGNEAWQGCHIYYPSFAAVDFKYKDELYHIVKVEDVWLND